MDAIKPSTRVLGLIILLSALVSAALSQEYSEYGNPSIPVTIGKALVQAEVVSSPDRLYLGLSYRLSLAEGRGMLFLMPEREIQHFCMRGMRFAIDIIWIGDGKVAGIEANVSPQDDRTLALMG